MGRPKTTQDHPKMASRRSCCDVLFASFFALIFGRFLVRFWCHLGTLLGAQIGHFWHRFLDDFFMSFQERPKSGQEPPKRGPRAAKSTPRAAKIAPRAAQE